MDAALSFMVGLTELTGYLFVTVWFLARSYDLAEKKEKKK